MTSKEIKVIYEKYVELSSNLEKYPTNIVVQGQILVVEQIILSLGLGWKDLHTKMRRNIQLMNEYAH